MISPRNRQPVLLKRPMVAPKTNFKFTINGHPYEVEKTTLKRILKNNSAIDLDSNSNVEINLDGLPKDIDHADVRSLLNGQITLNSDNLQTFATLMKIENLSTVISNDSKFVTLEQVSNIDLNQNLEPFDSETIVRYIFNMIVSDHESAEKYFEKFYNLIETRSDFNQTLKRFITNALKNAIENGNEVKTFNEICFTFRTLFEKGILTEADLNLNLGNRLLPPQFHDLVQETNRTPYRLFKAAIESLSANNFKLHKEYLKAGVNPDVVYNILRKDDIEKFKQVTSISDFNEEHYMKSVYERCSFVNNDYMCYVDISAFFGSSKIFLYLLEDKKARLTSKTAHYAICGGDKEIIEYCDNHSLSFDGTLTDAIQFHRHDLFKWLVEEKKLPIDNCIDQLITVCFQFSNFKSLLYLIDMPSLKISGMNIIEQCCRWGCTPLLQYFLSKMFIPSVLNGENINVFHLACQNGNPDVCHFLCKQKFVDVNSKVTSVMGAQGWAGIHFAASKGNVDALRVLVDCPDVDVDARTQKNQSALHFACERSLPESVQILLSSSKIDITCKIMNTDMGPLHIACQKGNYEIVKMLMDVIIKEGLQTEVNSLSQGNMTPLHLACIQGNSDIVKCLCQVECIDLNMKNFENFTPIQLACINHHTECVKILLEQKGIDLNCSVKFDFSSEKKKMASIEEESSKNRNNSLVKLSLTNRSNSDFSIHNNKSPEAISLIETRLNSVSTVHLIQEEDELTITFYEAMINNFEIFKMLVENDSLDINKQQPGSGISVLHLCCQQGQTEFVKLLLERKDLDINLMAAQSMTALHFAARAGHADIVKLLISNPNILLNPKTAIGLKTPLHLACEKGMGKVVEVLCETTGIDFTAKTASGKTPIQLAGQNGYSDIFALLTKHNMSNFRMGSPTNSNQKPTFGFVPPNRQTLSPRPAPKIGFGPRSLIK
ncbi:hypothetical protein TRFO_07871 [Tritrichomonas foetus]|uniref:DUF3447 domain-containing protein n=1 Tax=Tritrichomonas foetus TaxID=1144522 RepID=A0A1J4JP86_9EUKA|nr:hypothetical protein TRFO_07871 [Tritrichomonas foetus]|eukprot:OHT00554.1 hypothetical protein TRFO_07871 [Tritrichomonas foetus]